jgi:hypothetical protein
MHKFAIGALSLLPSPFLAFRVKFFLLRTFFAVPSMNFAVIFGHKRQLIDCLWECKFYEKLQFKDQKVPSKDTSKINAKM